MLNRTTNHCCKPIDFRTPSNRAWLGIRPGTAFSALILSLFAMTGSLAGTVSTAWTETFDNGVGRFNMTTGHGDTTFVHNPMDGILNATFERRCLSEPERDTRLAILGRTFTENDIFGYSFVWTPVSENGTPHPLIGLFNSTIDNAPAVVVDIDEPDFHILIGGVEVGGQGKTFWAFGNTYFVEFLINGPQQEIRLRNSRQDGDSFVLQDEFTYSWPDGLNFEADMIGFSNILDSQCGAATFAIEIDAFSFAQTTCAGDCDFDGNVDFNDLVSMLFEFGTTTDGPCDADGTGLVNFNDLTTALFLFGPCE